jgi:hypothetical protein
VSRPPAVARLWRRDTMEGAPGVQPSAPNRVAGVASWPVRVTAVRIARCVHASCGSVSSRNRGAQQATGSVRGRFGPGEAPPAGRRGGSAQRTDRRRAATHDVPPKAHRCRVGRSGRCAKAAPPCPASPRERVVGDRGGFTQAMMPFGAASAEGSSYGGRNAADRTRTACPSRLRGARKGSLGLDSGRGTGWVEAGQLVSISGAHDLI